MFYGLLIQVLLDDGLAFDGQRLVDAQRRLCEVLPE